MKNYFEFPDSLFEIGTVKREIENDKNITGIIDLFDESLDDKTIVPFKGFTEKDKENIEKNGRFPGSVIETSYNEEELYAKLKEVLQL